MNIIDKIINLIYPKNCIYCNKENTYLCNNCLEKIKQEIQENQNHVLNYQNHKTLIHLLKYKNIQCLKKEIAILLNEYFKKNLTQNKQYILIPIPLHKHKLKTRGFNQTELIAREVIKLNKNITLNTSLKRIINTKQQAKLSKQKRQKNTQNIFQTNDLSLFNKNIIIFDDVKTTGSTLKSAKHIVQKLHPKHIKTISFLK
jgi:competence protein ComFC